MIYVIVEDNKVINRVVSDEALEPNWYQNDEAQIGWLYEEGVFTPPPEEIIPIVVPESITARQARLVLHSKGLLNSVEPSIESLPEPERTNAKIEWEYATTLHRNNPFITVLGNALGLTETEIDELFIEGNNL